MPAANDSVFLQRGNDEERIPTTEEVGVEGMCVGGGGGGVVQDFSVRLSALILIDPLKARLLGSFEP